MLSSSEYTHEPANGPVLAHGKTHVLVHVGGDVLHSQGFGIGLARLQRVVAAKQVDLVLQQVVIAADFLAVFGKGHTDVGLLNLGLVLVALVDEGRAGRGDGHHDKAADQRRRAHNERDATRQREVLK